MKDNKFKVLCVLGAIWLALFIGTLVGLKLSPKMFQLVSVIWVAWFAYWTISYGLSDKNKVKEELVSEILNEMKNEKSETQSEEKQ